MSALAQVVLVGVHHHGPPDDAVLPGQGDHLVSDVDLGGAALRCHVAEVPGVTGALGILWGAVTAAVRVKMRPGTGAAIGVVTKLRLDQN